MLGTSNYANYSRRNPKRSAEDAHHIGMLASSITHAGISSREKLRSIGNSFNVQWIFFQSLTMSSRKEGRPHGHRYGRKPSIVHFVQKETEAHPKFVKSTMDFLSLPEYVIKKGRLHGHRYGKKTGDKEYYLADQLKKKSEKKKFQGIHDRF